MSPLLAMAHLLSWQLFVIVVVTVVGALDKTHLSKGQPVLILWASDQLHIVKQK